MQWTIKPQLEKWAEVRSFDPPGIGDEPLPEELTRQAVADRGLREIERAGWESYFVVADGWGLPVVARMVEQRRDGVLGMALGHACLSHRRHGPRAPINADVYAAMKQLIENDAPSFIRYGIVQSTAGSIDEEVAEQMLGRMPADRMLEGWTLITAEEAFEESLLSLRCPLLLAKHEGCLMSTDEGFEDAVAALPEAEVVAVSKAPCTSAEFSEALKDFCTRVGSEAPAA